MQESVVMEPSSGASTAVPANSFQLVRSGNTHTHTHTYIYIAFYCMKIDNNGDVYSSLALRDFSEFSLQIYVTLCVFIHRRQLSSRTEAIKTHMKKIKKYLLIPSLNVVPARFRTTFTSLIQRIECPRKFFFLYLIQFRRHSMLNP
jgi:hypothetical protein